MGRYRRYKNKLEMYLESEKGRRLLNVLYSWGASIVILGALFKLLHLPYGDIMLFVGMMTEFLVFFISGFDQPAKDYHWDEVFPQLSYSKNPMDRETMEAKAEYERKKAEEAMKSAQEGMIPPITNFYPPVANYTGGVQSSGNISNPHIGATSQSSALSQVISDEEVRRLSESIERVSNVAEELGKLSELSSKMMESYSVISSENESLGENSRGYIRQMEDLNRNISGLNTIYEIQLKSISSQIETIDRINSGLNRIKDMYDSTVPDSSIFRTENERMARQLKELNEVYARLLQAMTVNMHTPMPSSGEKRMERPEL